MFYIRRKIRARVQPCREEDESLHYPKLIYSPLDVLLNLLNLFRLSYYLL